MDQGGVVDAGGYVEIEPSSRSQGDGGCFFFDGFDEVLNRIDLCFFKIGFSALGADPCRDAVQCHMATFAVDMDGVSPLFISPLQNRHFMVFSLS